MSLLHLLLLLLLLHVTSHGLPAPSPYNSAMCSQSYSCGGVVIKYPFYLSTATEYYDDTPYYCGYPGLGITCKDGETPILQLNKDNYTVKGIDYTINNITLADTDVLTSGNCPRVRHNVSFGPAWLHYASSNVDNLTFFFDCSLPPFSPPPPHVIANPINTSCSSFPSDAGLSFVFPTPDIPKDYDLTQMCRDIVVAPVLKDMLSNMKLPQLPSGYGSVLKQGFELAWNPSAGQCGYNQTGGFLGCLCSNGQPLPDYCNTPGGASSKRREKIYITAGMSSLFVLCLFLFTCFLYYEKSHGLLAWKKGSKNAPRIESFLQKHGMLHPKRYTYSEVKRMTKSFAHKLGQGGCGAVYKGNLPDGHQIAVKMLKESKGDGEEFMNEVASISRTSHVNIVTLLGFCLQGSKRALIYDYMPNGSLERFAFSNNSQGENSLSWEKLFEIAVGIARGLEYLHRGCNTRIVHFDIKPHNILLDQDFCPKISDFGLAKLCMPKESIISIGGARGTIGYIAPEVFSRQFGVVSSKSDVYSYGMMVLEMAGARKNINVSAEASSEYFPQWIYEHLDQYCVNTCEINGETTELVRKMIIVGLWCIQVMPTDRPSMSRVIEMYFESSMRDLQLPPKSLLN